MKYLFAILMLAGCGLGVRVPPECDFKIPTDKYQMVKDSAGNYAIRLQPPFSDYFLCINRYGITSASYSDYDPATFKDSCRAKGLLKQYIIKITPEMRFK